MLQNDLLIAVLRIIVGALFVGHGAQKLFGWFGGHGLEEHSQWIRSLGFRPARFWGIVSALGEFIGGLALAVGLLTPVAAAILVAIMLVAIFAVHWANGLWNTNGGFEYNLVLLANAFVVAALGPNAYAVDQLIELAWPYATVFTVSMIAAVVVAALALVAGRTTPPQAADTRRERAAA